MKAIRGAITVDANTAEAITEAAQALISQITATNDKGQFVSITISSTPDITAKYPATAIREWGVTDIPLFSCAEPNIDGALKMCIRILVHTNSDQAAKHAYMGGAKALRQDLGD